MSALAMSRGPEQSWDDLVRLWEGTRAPEGSKVEIIEGIVTVSPSPARNHNRIVARIIRQLAAVIPEDWDINETQSVSVPSQLAMYIPDLVVTAPDEGDGPSVPAAAAELVVEVTSPSSLRHDRIAKAAGYAAGAAPLYLLVDRWAPEGAAVTLYGEPSDGVYRVLWSGKFGEPVPLPEPFGFALDTRAFPLD